MLKNMDDTMPREVSQSKRTNTARFHSLEGLVVVKFIDRPLHGVLMGCRKGRVGGCGLMGKGLW